MPSAVAARKKRSLDWPTNGLVVVVGDKHGIEPGTCLEKGCRKQRADAPLTVDASLHQTGLLEHFKVPGNRWSADRERGAQISHVHRSEMGQSFHDGSTNGIGQCRKYSGMIVAIGGSRNGRFGP